MANEIKGFYDRDDQKHDIVTSEQLDAAAAERVSAIKEADIEVVLDGSDVSTVDCLVDNESVELDAFDNYTDKVRLVNVMIVGDDDEVILNRLGYYLSRSRKIAGNKQQRTQIIASGEYMISRTGVFGAQTPGWGDWSYLPSKTDVIASDNYLPVTSAAVYTALALKAPSNHGHVKIENITEEAISSIHANGDEIEFFIEDMSGEEPIDDTVTLTLEKMGNFKRALETPELAADPNANTKLVTFGKVVELLTNKADADKISHLPDITLLVLKLAASAGIENLSWDAIDSNATCYSITSLWVHDKREYSIGDVCKISDGTTTMYAKVTSFNSDMSVVNFNDAFTSIYNSPAITISKLS